MACLPAGYGRGRGAIGEIQFEQNIGDVALDRVLADRQPPGDGRIAQAIGYKHNDFTLARTQKIEVRRGTPRSGLLRRVRLRTVMVADSEQAQPGFESLDRFSPVLGEVEPGAVVVGGGVVGVAELPGGVTGVPAGVAVLPGGVAVAGV